jgi:hypothetical protein
MSLDEIHKKYKMTLDQYFLKTFGDGDEKSKAFKKA